MIEVCSAFGIGLSIDCMSILHGVGGKYVSLLIATMALLVRQGEAFTERFYLRVTKLHIKRIQ
jgi:hypothetical protein